MFSAYVGRLSNHFANHGTSRKGSALLHPAYLSSGQPQRQHVEEKSFLSSHEEDKIPVPWGHIAAKWWGRRDVTPVIGMHGAHENAGAFNRLAPLLNISSFYTWDLPGHGRSSPAPRGSLYTYLSFVVSLKRVLDHHGWHRVSIIGHSFGSGIGHLFASVYPERVEKLVGLECSRAHVEMFLGSVAGVTGITRIKRQLEEMLKAERADAEGNPACTMADLEEAYYKLTLGSINKEHIHHLLERGSIIHPTVPGRFCLSNDPKNLHNRFTLFHPDFEILKESARNIKCHVLTVLATQGYVMGARGANVVYAENFYECEEIIRNAAASYTRHVVEGTHDAHLNCPEKIAPLINKFLAE